MHDMSVAGSDMVDELRVALSAAHPAETDDALYRLFSVLCFWQLALHLLACAIDGDPRLLMPHLVAWLHDLLLFSLIAGSGAAVGRLVPEKQSSISVITRVILAASGMLLALYPQTLREYLSFPANIFLSDSSSIGVTLFEYLGIRRLWPLPGTLMLFAVARYLPLKRITLRAGLLALSPVILAGLATLPGTPHPVMFSLIQSLSGTAAGSSRAVPSLRPSSGSTATPLQAAADTMPRLSSELTADRVFIIVLEGISSAEFEGRFLNRQSRFLERVQGRYSYFSKYHTTNLDSYTSLIAMLTSQQVPYRCYAEPHRYEAVNRSANLVSSLNSRGYYSLFTSTYAYQPYIPVKNDWNRIMLRSDLGQQIGMVTVGSSRMEEAVEDRAAIPAIVETAASHKKTLVMAELVYGHTTEWQAKTRIEPLDYYDRYLAELFDALQAKGLDRRSLFIVVSDHGDRSKADTADNYRVPLLIAGDGVQAVTDSHFRNHLDLQQITTAYLNGTPLPPAREKQFAVGSTERWIYGELRANGDHLFIDDRSGRVLSAAGGISPNQAQQEFQQYLNRFESQFGDRQTQAYR